MLWNSINFLAVYAVKETITIGHSLVRWQIRQGPVKTVAGGDQLCRVLQGGELEFFLPWPGFSDGKG